MSFINVITRIRKVTSLVARESTRFDIVFYVKHFLQNLHSLLNCICIDTTNWFCNSLVFLFFCKKLCHLTSLPTPDKTLDMKSNPVDSFHFENNFKRTVNCPVTGANMNERSKQRNNWRYHCFMTYVTQQWRSCELLSYCYVTSVTEQRSCQPEWM